jgi:hypothetical protein
MTAFGTAVLKKIEIRECPAACTAQTVTEVNPGTAISLQATAGGAVIDGPALVESYFTNSDPTGHPITYSLVDMASPPVALAGTDALLLKIDGSTIKLD